MKESRRLFAKAVTDAGVFAVLSIVLLLIAQFVPVISIFVSLRLGGAADDRRPAPSIVERDFMRRHHRRRRDELAGSLCQFFRRFRFGGHRPDLRFVLQVPGFPGANAVLRHRYQRFRHRRRAALHRSFGGFALCRHSGPGQTVFGGMAEACFDGAPWRRFARRHDGGAYIAEMLKVFQLCCPPSLFWGRCPPPPPIILPPCSGFCGASVFIPALPPFPGMAYPVVDGVGRHRRPAVALRRQSLANSVAFGLGPKTLIYIYLPITVLAGVSLLTFLFHQYRLSRRVQVLIWILAALFLTFSFPFAAFFGLLDMIVDYRKTFAGMKKSKDNQDK